MDLWSIFMFFLLTFLLMSCCGYCCTRKRRGAVLTTAPVVVTGPRTQTVPQGNYTVTQIPIVTANVSSVNASYPTQTYNRPYPTQATTVPVPMAASAIRVAVPPPTSGYGTGVILPSTQHMGAFHAVQPSMVTQQANTNPPPYDLAVASNPMSQPNMAGYEKQAPYNPYFQN